MARTARIKSESGIYHIIMRGINKQSIFLDEEDNRKFVKILRACQKISGFNLYAYCLMGNHLHLLIKEEKEPIDLIIKRIGTRFVYWYNLKYQRVGHLFQDRFKSEPVEGDEYFITVVRYIHQNPVKAGICKKCEQYPYSSYNAYFLEDELVDTSLLLGMMNTNQFLMYHNELVQTECLELIEPTIRMTHEQANRYMKALSQCESGKEFCALDRKQQRKLVQLFKQQNITYQQISSFTQKPIGYIQRLNES